LAIALMVTCSEAQFPATAQASSTISVGQRTNLSAAGGSFMPSCSDDGRFVVFVSFARNLVTNDDSAPFLDVFVRDLANAKTMLINVNTSGIGGGNDNSGSPAISSNGQFIAFQSAASNLVSNDTNGLTDVFLRDLVS